MRKSSMLIVAMVMACFVITAVNSNNVLACDQCDGCEQKILKGVTQVKHILKRQVLPRLGSVPKTGQTLCYGMDGSLIDDCTGTGHDGEYQKGVAWPTPRFTDNEDGTVTDNLTGLVWLRDANCISTHYSDFDNDGTVADGQVTWQHALDFVAGINNGTYPNCGAGYTDWRLANVRELHSLVHYDFANPALPNTVGMGQSTEGDPFTNTPGGYAYWTSTTTLDNTAKAFYVGFKRGSILRKLKTKASGNYVWPVRGPE
jgi:hypothetical protein